MPGTRPGMTDDDVHMRLRAAARFARASRWRCRSSVVEHPLGKGEVVSSILTGSTRKSPDLLRLSNGRPGPSRADRCRTMQENESITARFRHAETPFVLPCPLACGPP